MNALRTGNCFGAAAALLGEQFSETVGAIGFLLARGKLLTSQHLVAVRTREALAVPRRVLVRYAAFVDHLMSNNSVQCTTY